MVTMREAYSLHFEDGKLYVFKLCADGLFKPCDRHDEKTMFDRPVLIERVSAYLANRPK